jgi:hypothetical protein
MSSTKARLVAAACVFAACNSDRAADMQSTSAGFHEDLAFPAVPPPECDATVSCSSISYKHERKTCADLDLTGVIAKTVPLHFGTGVVVPLSPGESISLTSTLRILVRLDGGETVYYSWSFTSTMPIQGAILRGDAVTQPDSIVYRFDPFATTATGHQGSWIAWVCGEGHFEDNCLYPFDPVEAELCYRDAAPADAGASDHDGGKSW